MGTQEITAARYYQGVNNALNVDRMPFTGFDTTWSVKPAASPPYLPRTTTPTRPRPGRRGRRVARRSTSGSRRDRAVPKTSRARTLKTVLEIAQKQGAAGRRRLDRGDHRRDAGCPRLAHLAARLPGPGQHGRLPDRDEGRRRPRLDRRAGGRSQGRRAARRRPRPLRADRSAGGPDAGQNGCRVRAGQGLPATSPTRPASAPSRASPTNRCSACSTQATCRSSGAVHRRSLGKGNAPAAPLQREPAPGERAEPLRR